MLLAKSSSMAIIFSAHSANVQRNWWSLGFNCWLCRILYACNPQSCLKMFLNVEKSQDGGTCHTAGETINLLSETFCDRIISRNGPVNWPPHSCDLTLLDYFLLEFVKSKVCCNKPETLLQLEENIRRVIGEIQSELLRTVCDYWTSRLRHVRETSGGHMPETIFKY